MKLHEISNDIEKFRNDLSSWEIFKADDGKNEALRYAIALALQYDRKESDEAFIRYLFTEEIKWKSVDPYQGYEEAYMILSFLLSKYKRVEDAFLFERAKYANFDTSCGYSALFAFSAGVKKTWDYVLACDLDESNPIFYEEREIYEDLSEEEVVEFLEALEEDYPENRSNLSLKEQFDEAISLEDMEMCQKLFSSLENELEAEDLFDLALRAEFHESTLKYGEVVLKQKETPSGKSNMAQRLMLLYSQNGDYAEALHKARESYAYLCESKNSESHFGYLLFVEFIFKASREVAKGNAIRTANAIFDIGDAIYREQGNMSLNVAEIAYECCELTQSKHLAFYESEYVRYRADVDDMMAKVIAASKGD